MAAKFTYQTMEEHNKVYKSYPEEDGWHWWAPLTAKYGYHPIYKSKASAKSSITRFNNQYSELNPSGNQISDAVIVGSNGRFEILAKWAD